MANENNMIPCPYNCKQGAHPKGSKFCPFTGKSLEDLPVTPTVEKNVAPESRHQTHSSPRTRPKTEPTPYIKPGGVNIKKILAFSIPLVLVAVVAGYFIFQNGAAPKTVIKPVETIEKLNGPELGSSKKTSTGEGGNQDGGTRDEVVEINSHVLASEIKSDYNRQLRAKDLHTVPFNRLKDIKVSGQVELLLTIDENGSISIQRFDNSNKLIVSPKKERSRILGMLKRDIGQRVSRHTLIPQSDRTSARLKITDFPLVVTIKETVKILQFNTFKIQPGAETETRTREPIQFPVNGNIDVRGEIKFFLTIDENGNCRIQREMDSNSLEVSPLSQKETVIRLAKNKLANLTFQPLQEADGTLLKITGVPITVIPRPVRLKEFKELPAGIIQAYKKQMSQMGDVPIEKKIQVNGQISFRLAIDENGKISIESSDNSPLQVTPRTSKSKIINMIKTQIQGRTLTPQTNENGAFLRISNFPLTIEVTMNNRRLKLERLREF